MAILIKETLNVTNEEKMDTLTKIFKELVPNPSQRVVISSFKSYKELSPKEYAKKIIATNPFGEGLTLGSILPNIKGAGKLIFAPSEVFENTFSYRTFEKHTFVFFRGKDKMPFMIKEIVSLQDSFQSLNEDIKKLKEERVLLRNKLRELKNNRVEANKQIKKENKLLKEEFKKV